MAVNIDNYDGTRDSIDSPRTIEAALSCGIDLRDLYPKSDIELLPKAGYDKTKAAALAIHFEGRRQQYVGQVRAERSALIERLTNTRSKGAIPGAFAVAPSMGGSRIASHVEELRRASILEEQKRADFAKEKQKAEVESMIANEVRLAQMAETNMRAERDTREREERRRKEIEVSRKKEIEERRKRDLKAKEAAEVRVQLMRREAQAAFAAEARTQATELAAQKKLLLMRKREDEERRIAQTEADARRVEEMEEQARELERRLRDWEEKEVLRVAKMDESRAELATLAEAKAAAAQRRLDAALSKDAEIMSSKRRVYEARVSEATTRRLDKEAIEAETLKRRAIARAAKQKKMTDALTRARKDEVAWTQKLAAAAHTEEAVLAAVLEGKEAETHERSVSSMLHMYERMETVRRERRKDEYKRMQNLLRLMGAEKRLAAEEEKKRVEAVGRQVHQKRLLMMKHVAETELTDMRVKSNFAGLSKLMERTMGAGKSRAVDES